jgi:hypothetical protein
MAKSKKVKNKGAKRWLRTRKQIKRRLTRC